MSLQQDAENVKKVLGKKTRERKLTDDDFLSSGIFIMDMAFGGKPGWGYPKGKVILLVGGSNSGKTFVAHQALASANIDPKFDNYDFYYDNTEDGALMELAKFWPKLAASGRIKPPRRDKSKKPVYSTTVDEFYDNVEKCLSKGKPIIYVEDSFDVLDTGEKDEKDKMGGMKAKQNKRRMRRIMSQVSKTGSILIIICHAMQNMGADRQWKPETRSGGSFLTFMATNEVWFNVKKKLKRKVSEKYRTIGQLVSVRVVRTRVSGRDWEVQIPILHQYGVDNTGSMVDFLVLEGHWKATYNKTDKYAEPKIEAPEFDFNGKREKLIQKIEKLNAEEELQGIVVNVWSQIDNGCKVTRKQRF